LGHTASDPDFGLLAPFATPGCAGGLGACWAAADEAGSARPIRIAIAVAHRIPEKPHQRGGRRYGAETAGGWSNLLSDAMPTTEAARMPARTDGTTAGVAMPSRITLNRLAIAPPNALPAPKLARIGEARALRRGGAEPRADADLLDPERLPAAPGVLPSSLGPMRRRGTPAMGTCTA
jgi:hypothetical protein